MRSKYRRLTLALIISGDIHGAGRLMFMDFDLTGACWSSKVLNVVCYCSYNCDKSCFRVGVKFRFYNVIIISKNINVVNIPIENITLRINWNMLNFISAVTMK